MIAVTSRVDFSDELGQVTAVIDTIDLLMGS
jgi:hypothetical protein